MAILVSINNKAGYKMKNFKNRMQANKSLYEKISRSMDSNKPLKIKIALVASIQTIHNNRFL